MSARLPVRSPFPASNLPFGSSGCTGFSPHRLTWLASAPFRARQEPVSGRLSRPPPWKGAARRPGFPLPFGRRRSLLGHPVPPGIPPLSRSAYRRAADHAAPRTMTGFPRSAHMRCGRIGCPLYPGTSGARTGHVQPWPAACRLSPARVLHPGDTVTYPGLLITRRHQGFTAIHPPGLPLARRPRMTRELLGLLPWAPHPHGQDPCTHARAGTGSEH